MALLVMWQLGCDYGNGGERLCELTWVGSAGDGHEVLDCPRDDAVCGEFIFIVTDAPEPQHEMGKSGIKLKSLPINGLDILGLEQRAANNECVQCQ